MMDTQALLEIAGLTTTVTKTSAEGYPIWIKSAGTERVFYVKHLVLTLTPCYEQVRGLLGGIWGSDGTVALPVREGIDWVLSGYGQPPKILMDGPFDLKLSYKSETIHLLESTYRSWESNYDGAFCLEGHSLNKE